MSVMEQAPDGTWRPACPEPYYVGWRLRKARCGCGVVLKNVDLYRDHWRAVHGEVAR